jgi:hypothetical protein
MAGAPLGNQNAAKPRRWAAAIDRALDKRAQERGLRDAQEALDQLAEKFLDAVEVGDIAAFREFADRMDGKPAQAITGDGGGPVEAIFRWQP